jgi:ribosomal protein S18 acetylase RimI-like enzyme
MNIIKATLEHLEIIATLFDEYRQFYKQKPDINSALNFIAERIKNNESVIFLALVNDRGAGFTQLYPSFSSVSMKRLWILNDLYVSPDYRKQNVAGELIREAVKLGQETDALRITLETDMDNYPAQSLYDKIGFEKTSHCFYYNLNISV